MLWTVHEPCVLSVLTLLLLGMTILPGLAQGPSRTLMRHADLVITMEPRLGDGALGLITNGDVLIEDDRIAAVGQGLDGAGARIIDATGKIVLPGFVDVHNHLWQSLIRGCGTSLAVGVLSLPWWYRHFSLASISGMICRCDSGGTENARHGEDRIEEREENYHARPSWHECT